MVALNASASGPLSALRRLLPELQHPSMVVDDTVFPAEALRLVAEAGVLSAPLPAALGGSGLGTEPRRGAPGFALLYLLGQASLPLGRLVEAHINALRIVMRYGDAAQRVMVAEAVRAGALLALWVTDPPGDGGLRFTAASGGLALAGRKMFCSGAGFATHAVVTAADDARPDTSLLLVDLGGAERVSALPAGLAGMKAAVSAQVDFTGVTLPPERVLGAPGDYLREPDFSAGAWRSSAVALGGLGRLLNLVREQLVSRGRQDDPHQRARFGAALIGHEASRLLLGQAAESAEDLVAETAAIVAAVGLARIAVERACLDGIECAQRSLGLAAFVTANPVERVIRDLATYLRQPAADEVLHNAAGWAMLHGLPEW